MIQTRQPVFIGLHSLFIANKCYYELKTDTNKNQSGTVTLLNWIDSVSISGNSVVQQMHMHKTKRNLYLEKKLHVQREPEPFS